MKLTEVKEFVKELRGLSQEELAKRENELKKELFELRFQAATGQLEQTARLKEVKKPFLKSSYDAFKIGINLLIILVLVSKLCVSSASKKSR